MYIYTHTRAKLNVYIHCMIMQSPHTGEYASVPIYMYMYMYMYLYIMRCYLT